MSSEHNKKTTTKPASVFGSSRPTTSSTEQPVSHQATSTTYAPFGQTTTYHEQPTVHTTTTYHDQQNVHPTGYHQETRSQAVEQTGNKWSEEASMVGSDVREGLGKYKDVRPATGATGLDQATGTGTVHESGHTDASVYRPHDMTDTATKVGSDQREGLGSAAKGTTTTTTEKDAKHHHKHGKDRHHHKHDHEAATYGTMPYTETGYSSTSAYPAPTTTTHSYVHPTESKTYGTTGTGYSTTSSYTDTSGTPSSTHNKYDASEKSPYYGSSPTHANSDTTTTAHRDYSSPSRDTTTDAYADSATKLGSDKREGLGTGAAYGTGMHGETSGMHHTGWADTATKSGSDKREGLGSGSSTTGQYYQ